MSGVPHESWAARPEWPEVKKRARKFAPEVGAKWIEVAGRMLVEEHWNMTTAYRHELVANIAGIIKRSSPKKRAR